MANTDKPLGFKPVRYRDGRPYMGQANTYFIGAGNTDPIAVGDLVKLGGDSNPGDSLAEYAGAVRVGAVTDRPIGVVTGIAFDPNDLSMSTYRPASVARYLRVADSPDLLLEAQGDTAPTGAQLGLNVSPTLGVPNAVSGTSTMEVDISSAATTDSLMLYLTGLVPRADNSLAANAQVLVGFNVHQFKEGQTGV